MRCHAIRSVPAVGGVCRLAPISRLSAPSDTGLELRPLPSTGVTRRPRYYEPLRHPMRPGLSLAGARLSPRDSPRGASRVASVSPSRHAVFITPVGPLGRFARGPAYSSLALIVSDVSLPRVSAGSAPTLNVSRPAQRSLALRPACSLHRQSDTSVSKAPTVSLPPHELPRLVRGVERLRGGCFWLERWTTHTIPPGPQYREPMPEDEVPQRCAWPQACRVMATASIDSPTAWAVD